MLTNPILFLCCRRPSQRFPDVLSLFAVWCHRIVCSAALAGWLAVGSVLRSRKKDKKAPALVRLVGGKQVQTRKTASHHNGTD